MLADHSAYGKHSLHRRRLSVDETDYPEPISLLYRACGPTQNHTTVGVLFHGTQPPNHFRTLDIQISEEARL